VLRPAIADRVRNDLQLLDALTRPLGAALPRLDAAAIIAEVRDRVLEEFDLESEADSQRRIHRALRDHPTFVTPAPVSRLAHHTVLVTPWLEGRPLAATDGRERDRGAALYVAFVLGSAHFGLAQASPGPQDALVLADGRLALLDFGAVAETDPDRVRMAADALEALRENDGSRFSAALALLGGLTAGDGARAHRLARHGLGRLARRGPHRLDGAEMMAARERLAERPADLARLAGAGTLVAGDLWPLRGAGQVFATIALTGGATVDWLALASSALRHGWDAARDVERFLA